MVSKTTGGEAVEKFGRAVVSALALTHEVMPSASSKPPPRMLQMAGDDGMLRRMNLEYQQMATPDTSQTYATAVNCMDGRVQIPVMEFTKARFGVDFVDMITEAGAVADINDGVRLHVRISVEAHGSRGIVVAAHSDCAGNIIPDQEQKNQCLAAALLLQSDWPEMEVIPVWVPVGGEVEILNP